MIKKSLILLLPFTLSACYSLKDWLALTNPALDNAPLTIIQTRDDAILNNDPTAHHLVVPNPAVNPPVVANPIPYPEPNYREQIQKLGIQITHLNEQLKQLNQRIQHLEHHPNLRATVANTHTPNPPQKNKNPNNSNNNNKKTPEAPPPPPSMPTPKAENATETLKEAQDLYHQGKYQAVLKVLQGSENGGDGSNTARQKMYLVLQSHRKLNNCQSVINIGQRYASRYTAPPQASDALYIVGECQWRLQQQDIAKNTWAKLLRLYPNTQAGESVKGILKK